MAGALPPIADLLPHQPPWRFVRRIVAHGGDDIACTGAIPREALPGWIAAPTFAGIEVAAQAAAALEALARWRTTGELAPRTGYLVSVRDAEFHVDALPFERRLLATVRCVASAPPLRVYEATVTRAGVLCLRASLGTYLEEATP